MSAQLVSTIMSIHNGQKFVFKAIDSILTQTYRNIELIVVDDGSTDNTPNILREISDHRFRIITLDRNVGLVDALNIALSEVRGELIARMDADDIAYPERIALQVKRMDREPRLVLLGTAFDYIDAQGNIIRNQSVSTENELLQQRLFEEGNQFCHSSVMMRSDAVKRVGGYRKMAGRYAQDYDLWLRLAEVGTIENLSATLMGYRIHDGQISLNKLFLQRRTAEIYKILARQRRFSGSEDLDVALREVGGFQRKLRNAIAGDYLCWSDLLFRIGAKKRCHMMQIKALWIAPFSPAVRQFVHNGFCRRLKIFLSRNKMLV